MNTCFKLILDKAIDYPKSKEVRDDALDAIYTKLIASPLQKAWRNKSTEEKKSMSEFIVKNIYKFCFWCDTLLPSHYTRDCCLHCYLEEKYRYDCDD